MSGSKSNFRLTFFFIFVTASLIVQYGIPITSAEGSDTVSVGTNSQQNNEGQIPQKISTDNSKNITPINSYLSTNLTLGKGKPVSMSLDTKSNSLYVVSPSDTDSAVKNIIYVVDTTADKLVDTINIGNPIHDFLRDITVDTNSGMIYATGEYREEDAEVTYENDSIYFIDPKTKEYNRISVYYESEEGKEGDLSEIAVDSAAKLAYVGSLYPEGGMPGLYVVDPVKSHVVSMVDKWESGVSEVLVDSKSHQVVATAKYDNCYPS
jgi:hypothetical protein